MGISRQEMKARCMKLYEGVAVVDRERAHILTPYIGDALKGCVDYITQKLNPIDKSEIPFLIAGMEMCINQFKQIDPLAGEIASDILRTIPWQGIIIPEGSALEDAMRAMTGEGHDGREDK